MADNNKVTIDEARYDELRNAEKYLREHPQPPQSYVDELEKKLNNNAKELLALTNERDELKEKLEKYKTNNMFDACLGNECATAKRLAAAERCIEDCLRINESDNLRSVDKCERTRNTIRAYREKEAK